MTTMMMKTRRRKKRRKMRNKDIFNATINVVCGYVLLSDGVW